MTITIVWYFTMWYDERLLSMQSYITYKQRCLYFLCLLFLFHSQFFLEYRAFSNLLIRIRKKFYDLMSYTKTNCSLYVSYIEIPRNIGENNNMKHITYFTYSNMCRITKSLKYKTASIRYIVEIALSKAFYFLFTAGFPLARTIEMWKASSVFARISYCIWWVRPFFLP